MDTELNFLYFVLFIKEANHNDGGIGSGILYLPENIGVRVHVDGGIGSISAKGMNKDGKVYTNDAYGNTDVSIDIDVDAGIGSIDLILK